MFFVFFVICSIIVARPSVTRKRAPYAVLLVSILFQFISTVVTTAYQGLSLFDVSAVDDSIDKIIAFLAVPGFFAFWSLALLFLSVALFLRARALDQHLWEHSRKARLISSVDYTIFALIVILSTAANGLFTEYVNQIYSGLGFGDDTEQLIDNERDLNYAANAFFALSAMQVTLVAVAVHGRTRVLGLNDQVCPVRCRLD